MKFQIASISIMLLISTYTGAVTYYVDFESGNDAGDGLSTGTAWKHAPGDPNAEGSPSGTALAGGDRLKFRGGVPYYGTVVLKWSGTEGDPITYESGSESGFGEGRAIIDGEGEQLGIGARQYGFYGPSRSNVGKSFIAISGFEIRNTRHVYEDLPTSQPHGIYIEGSGAGIEIENNYLHGIKKAAFAVNTIKEGIYSDSDLLDSVSVTDAALGDSAQDFSIYAGGLQATHKVTVGWSRTDYYKAWAYLGPLSGGRDTVAVYKDINLTQPGWNYSAGYNPVGKGKYFYWIYDLKKGSHMNNGGTGITVRGHSNVLIHDNIVRHARGGISVAAEKGAADNVRIYNNDISLVAWGINPTAGGYAGEDLTNLEIYGNTLHDFRDFVRFDWGYHVDGVFLFNSGPTNDASIRGVKFYGNSFYGNIGNATALLYMSGNVSDALIYNNIFASSAGGGYQIRTLGSRSSINPTVRNVKIYNNTFAKIPGEDKYSIMIERSSDVSLRNNIIYLFEQMGAVFTADTFAASSFSSNNNLLDGARIYKGEVGYNGTTYDLEKWVAAPLPFGHDQESVIRQNPLFKKFPAFAAKVKSDGTQGRIFLAANANTYYDHAFRIGDFIEYNYDRTPRTVTFVGPDYIDVAPALPRISMAGERVFDWRGTGDLKYDLSLQNGSPAIGKGANLGAEIGYLDIAGATRPASGAWGIGAFENTSGPSAPVNGFCAATLNSCSSGSPDDTTDTASHYLWNCVGTDGGATANCQLAKAQPPQDTDSDGVLDANDKCPKTAGSARGHVNIYGCALPIAAKFDIRPDFNATDINGMQNLELGISIFGKISYFNKNITLVKIATGQDERLDIDAGLLISQNKITLNQNSLPQLSQSAIITFYNTDFDSPKILKDGTECTNCRITGYDKNTKTFVFSVPGF